MRVMLFTAFLLLMPSVSAQSVFVRESAAESTSIPLSHIMVVDYFSSLCPPCVTQKNLYNPKLRDAGIQVSEINADVNGDFVADEAYRGKQITGFPTLRLQRWDGSSWQCIQRGNRTANGINTKVTVVEWVGLTPSETILDEIRWQASQCQPSAASQSPDVVVWEEIQVPYTVNERVKIAGSGWNEGRSACGNAGCSMCYSQYRIQTVTKYRTEKRPVTRRNAVALSIPSEVADPPQSDADGSQAPCPAETMRSAIDLLNLTGDDVFVSFGCGIADECILAVESGARLAWGIEIDPVMVDRARVNVSQAVDSGRIPAGSVIIPDAMDIRDVDLDRVRATKGYAFLYPETLEMIVPKLRTLSCVVLPFHRAPGLSGGVQNGDVFVYVNQFSNLPW